MIRGTLQIVPDIYIHEAKSYLDHCFASACSGGAQFSTHMIVSIHAIPWAFTATVRVYLIKVLLVRMCPSIFCVRNILLSWRTYCNAVMKSQTSYQIPNTCDQLLNLENAQASYVSCRTIAYFGLNGTSTSNIKIALVIASSRATYWSMLDRISLSYGITPLP